MWKTVVVEDENKIREGFIFLLESLDYQLKIVGEAQNAEEALEVIERTKPDIVFMDIEIPGINGLKLIEESQKQYQYLPIIVSGYDYFEYLQKSIRLNVFDYLLKPVGLEDLDNTLQRAVEALEKQKSLSFFKNSVYYDPVKSLNLSCRNAEIRKIVSFIKQNYHKDICTQDAADYMGVSVPTLNKILSEAKLDTFSQTLLHYRMQRAVLFIIEGELLNYEIASQVGYADYKYFSQVFKKYFGFSINEMKTNIVKN